MNFNLFANNCLKYVFSMLRIYFRKVKFINPLKNLKNAEGSIKIYMGISILVLGFVYRKLESVILILNMMEELFHRL